MNKKNLGLVQIITSGLMGLLMTICASMPVFNFPEYRALMVGIIILMVVNLAAFLTREGII